MSLSRHYESGCAGVSNLAQFRRAGGESGRSELNISRGVGSFSQALGTLPSIADAAVKLPVTKYQWAVMTVRAVGKSRKSLSRYLDVYDPIDDVRAKVAPALRWLYAEFP